MNKGSKEMSEVAKEIFRQLGGNKFVMMTGAKNLCAGKNSLSMRIGRNSKSINGFRVTLQPNDLYHLEFLKIRKMETKVAKEHSDVFCGDLCSIFETETGLYTRLF